MTRLIMIYNNVLQARTNNSNIFLLVMVYDDNLTVQCILGTSCPKTVMLTKHLWDSSQEQHLISKTIWLLKSKTDYWLSTDMTDNNIEISPDKNIYSVDIQTFHTLTSQ